MKDEYDFSKARRGKPTKRDYMPTVMDQAKLDALVAEIAGLKERTESQLLHMGRLQVEYAESLVTIGELKDEAESWERQCLEWRDKATDRDEYNRDLLTRIEQLEDKSEKKNE